jgi:hypothetical protein
MKPTCQDRSASNQAPNVFGAPAMAFIPGHSFYVRYGVTLFGLEPHFHLAGFTAFN